MNETTASPLLSMQDARIDVDGVPAIDGLSLVTQGEHVLVLGAPRAAFHAATGVLAAVRGKIAIRGASPEVAVRDRLIAGCPLDPPLPPKWTPLEYITWSARLSGHDKTTAKTNAARAVERIELGAFATTPAERLVPHAKRATVLAAAMATGAPVLAIEDPLASLPEEIAHVWAGIFVAALSDRSWIVFAPRIPMTSPIVRAADEAVVISHAHVDAQGPPLSVASASRRFVLRLHGALDVFVPRLQERGAQVRVSGAQVVVDLGQTLSTTELLGISCDTNVTIVELHPVARALA